MRGAPALPDLEALSELDERLRARPTDARAVRDALARAETALAAARRGGDRRAEQRLLGYVGNARRLLGHHEAAVADLRESRRLAERLGDQRAAVVALARLGEALRCADRSEEAVRTLRRAEREAAASAAELRHFALQHLGKALLDAGDDAGARACLGEALALRRARGDAELVASTEAALRLLPPTQ
ncbi:MAG: hypothetical protein ICV64_05080 [Thermoleophilia bacterium]|nr:hypothetical protein [Thermoleophilia bacterium]